MSNVSSSFIPQSDGRPLVLLAEDDPTAAELLQMLLGRVGYDVRVAGDGSAALRMLEESPSPDVLLLDWMLPELTGLEVCRRVRERWDPLTLPILMVTARADMESVSAAFEAGASDYITKPFLGAELRARIAAHLRIKQLSEERRAMDEHLMERDKLSTLGLLVSGVAHDLNNPLGGISGYAQLLLEEETDPERLIALERIVSEVHRCNRIVADLLSFGRRHTPERLRVDVGDVLQAMLQLRDRHLQANGVLPHLCVEPGLPAVVADPHQLQQVFVNILMNAEYALRAGGRILRITAELAESPGGAESGWLAIRFFNDGPAIPPGVMSHIFDPFFTTKDKDEGTGLGLAICRRIVREHGGDIEADSSDAGTSFTILLPTEGAAGAAARAARSPDHAHATGSERRAS
ncbi:MAG: response regulator [Gemmatimonadota bacterium]